MELQKHGMPSYMNPQFYFSSENTFSALKDVKGDVYHFRLYFTLC